MRTLEHFRTIHRPRHRNKPIKMWVRQRKDDQDRDRNLPILRPLNPSALETRPVPSSNAQNAISGTKALRLFCLMMMIMMARLGSSFMHDLSYFISTLLNHADGGKSYLKVIFCNYWRHQALVLANKFGSFRCRCYSSKEMTAHDSSCFGQNQSKTSIGFPDQGHHDLMPFHADPYQVNPHPGPANPFNPDYYHSRPDPYPFHQHNPHFYNPYQIYPGSFPPPPPPHHHHQDWSAFPVDLHGQGEREADHQGPIQ